jgi:predicted transposase YbfD/YdcC
MLGIPDCNALIRLDKKIHRKGKSSFETRYFVSSLNPDEVSPAQFQDLILGHWEIENCLHGQKDRFYDEDKHSVRTEWGKVWTVLTNMAVSLTGLLRTNEKTLREVHNRCFIDPGVVIQRLGLKR